MGAVIPLATSSVWLSPSPLPWVHTERSENIPVTCVRIVSTRQDLLQPRIFAEKEGKKNRQEENTGWSKYQERIETVYLSILCMPWGLTEGSLGSLPTAGCCWRISPSLPSPRFLFDRVHGKASLLPPAAAEDGDVQAERSRVESGKADFDVVQLQNLTKIYHLPHKRITAVKNISLGIPAGEVSEGRRLWAPSSLTVIFCNGLFCSGLFLPLPHLLILGVTAVDKRLLVDLGHQVTV